MSDATELNLLINTTALKVYGRSADLVYIRTFCLSFHAIGRIFSVNLNETSRSTR
jgi:hypothetical protein